MRAWKSVGGSTTYFLYDGSNPICELDGTGVVTATNTWGGSLLSRRVATASTFYTFDPSGNIAQRLDGAGNVLGAYAFDAFGLRTGTDTTTDPYAGFGGGWAAVVCGCVGPIGGAGFWRSWRGVLPRSLSLALL